MICELDDFTENRMSRVATQYRESVNLLTFIRNLIGPLKEVGVALCEATILDIDTATGEHLTTIGKALGWPRVACAGIRVRTFGFECDDDCRTDIGGFCTNWGGSNCGPVDVLQGEFEFTNDELYRRFLKSLVVKYDNDFRRSAMFDALRELFGPDAGILREVPARVDVFTGRKITDEEFAIAHIIEQVLPVALGVSVGIYETPDGPPFGFGTGWGGFCDGEWPVQIVRGY